MKRKINWSVGLVVLMSVMAGCVWLVYSDNIIYGNNLVGTSKPSDEFMEEYFDSYAEMASQGEEENILIVVSHNKPDGHGANKIVEGPYGTYYLMYDSPEKRDYAYEALSGDDIVSVERNEMVDILSYNSWGITTMGIDNGIQALGENGEDVKVAIIDTGLDVELFQANYPSKVLTVYNVETDSDDLAEMTDSTGHGTHIAGTIAEGIGSQTSIMAIKVPKTEEGISVADINTAIYKAIMADVDVINMSLGGPSYSASQKLALDAANENNIIAVAAAGNSNSTDIFYPAGYDNTISVAALDLDLKRAVWSESESLGSNYNATVDYAAPGTKIRSINGFASGTSVATPHVVSVVALLKNYNKDLGLTDVNTLLRRHVVDLGEEGKDDYYGYGMIDLSDAEFCGDAYCDEYGVFAVNMTVYAKAGKVEAAVLQDGVVITSDEACMVIIRNNQEEIYTTIPAVKLMEEEDSFKFGFNVLKDTEIKVILKGDGNLDGEVSSADSNLINRSLISDTLPAHRDLSDLEKMVFDVNGDNIVTSADSNLINRSLISSSLAPYQKIAW